MDRFTDSVYGICKGNVCTKQQINNGLKGLQLFLNYYTRNEG